MTIRPPRRALVAGALSLATTSVVTAEITVDAFITAQFSLSGLGDVLGAPSEVLTPMDWEILVDDWAPGFEAQSLISAAYSGALEDAFSDRIFIEGGPSYLFSDVAAFGIVDVDLDTGLVNGQTFAEFNGIQDVAIFALDEFTETLTTSSYEWWSTLRVTDEFASFLLDSGLTDQDLAGQVIGTYSGDVEFEVVPAPGAVALLTLAGMFASRRRRH